VSTAWQQHTHSLSTGAVLKNDAAGPRSRPGSGHDPPGRPPIKPTEVTIMNVVRYEPWTLFTRLNRDLDRLFNTQLETGDESRSSVVD
jgi:hypothetical protein